MSYNCIVRQKKFVYPPIRGDKRIKWFVHNEINYTHRLDIVKTNIILK